MRSSSISRERRAIPQWLVAWLIAGLAMLCLVAPAGATDPHRMISQYARDLWGDKRGFPGGSVAAIAQTPDGYLWIGTDKGLVRFDGLNFLEFQQAIPELFPIGPVEALVTDASGDLWILLRSTKVLRFHGGKFELGHGEAEFGVTAVGKRKDGTVLLSSLVYGMLTYNGKLDLVPPLGEPPPVSGGLPSGNDDRSSRLSWTTSIASHRIAEPSSAVVSIAETSDGTLWLGTRDRGLFSVNAGRVDVAGKQVSSGDITCLLPLEKGELWIGTKKGIVRWNGKELTVSGVPASLVHREVFAMLRDHDSNIWLGTSDGLVRINQDGVTFDRSGSIGPVTGLFEDREGNIWVGRQGEIERLHDSTFVSYASESGHSTSSGPVFVDDDGHVWFAPLEGGLRWLKDAPERSLTNDGLGGDVVYSIAGRKNELWVGRRQGGLTSIRYGTGAPTTHTYTQADGLAQNSVYAVHESDDGTVWAGTLNAGVSQLKNGHFTNYTTAVGLASNTVSSIAEGEPGTMWFGTAKGLSAMSKDGWRTYTDADGLPSPDVNCILHDSGGMIWVGTAGGLAVVVAGRVQAARSIPDSLHEPIFGIAEDRNGWLWFSTASHVLQVKRTSLLSDSVGSTDIRMYGLADGLLGTEGVKRHRSVVEDSQGRIWFSTNRGLSTVNPSRAASSSAPALVHIEAVLADGNPFDLKEPVRISAKRQRTTFRFAGLSLTNSERVRYRYRLTDFDKDWSEPVAVPEASYANLAPGSYEFRVMASNSDGLWNGSEATLKFDVIPLFWQTWWFRIAVLSCVGLAALAAYRVRMRQVTRLLNVRFEERLAERTRIAQDLHDTLLQGVLSASMQLHVAVDQLPENIAARPTLNRVLELMGQVVNEGRNTLRGLRSSIADPDDLKASFLRVPQEVGKHDGVVFRLVVEGTATPLRAVIRDDIYSIGREALVNAFRHSQAGNIEMQMEYAPSELRILVRDDGCGIDPHVLHSGRDGHWGLSGMRERAKRIAADLKVMSGAGAGTEVELRVGGDIAFESSSAISASNWFWGRHKRKIASSGPARKERVG